MAGKDFNGGSDDFSEIDEFDDPGYNEPEYDDAVFDEPGSYEEDYEESEFGEADYDESDAELADPDAEADAPLFEEDGFIYDEEGHSEPTPTVYYYKDEENYEEDMLYEEPEEDEDLANGKKKMSLKKKILLGVGITFGTLLLFVMFCIFTAPGREILYAITGKIWDTSTDKVDETIEEQARDLIRVFTGDGKNLVDGQSSFESIQIRPEGPRSEEYVTTYLIFGIEEIDGAANTDAIMLISINKKDNTIKLTSIMRDTYVNIPGEYPNKINSVYARGAKRADDPTLKKATGAALLVNVIENTFDIDISGYACVNFKSFEKIVDRLGGIDIELGEKEAAYLRKTNYISNPANRTVKAGWNHMNGNQVLGYCRVRKVVTLGGANNDYGRTVRHRRVINAIINKFKSASYLDMLPIIQDCLAEIFTNIKSDQISDTVRDVIENNIFSTASMRLPAEEFFTDSGRKGIFNGSSNITYTLVLGDQLGKNIERLHQFVFLDNEGETDTTGLVGAGAGVAIGSAGSSSSSSAKATPTPTPVPAKSLVDESIPASVTEQGAEGDPSVTDLSGETAVQIDPVTGEIIPVTPGSEDATVSGDTQGTLEGTEGAGSEGATEGSGGSGETQQGAAGSTENSEGTEDTGSEGSPADTQESGETRQGEAQGIAGNEETTEGAGTDQGQQGKIPSGPSEQEPAGQEETGPVG